MKDKLKQWMKALENSRLAPLWQFVRFGVVGLSNTAISYGVEMLCYYGLFANLGWPEGVRVMVTTALAFLISVTNSYYWNNRYVFASGRKKRARQHWLAYGKTVLCYGVTGLALSPAVKLWLSGLGAPYYLAALASLVVTIPLNFVLNKFWAFADGRQVRPK